MATLAQVLAQVAQAPQWLWTQLITAVPVDVIGGTRNHVYFVAYRDPKPNTIKGDLLYVHVHDLSLSTEDAWIVEWQTDTERLPFLTYRII